LNQLPGVTATQLTAYPWIWFQTGAASLDLMAPYFQQRTFGHYIAGTTYRPSVRRPKAFTSVRDALLGELGSISI